MEAIRRHFRDYGASPSYRDLNAATGIATTDIGRLLRKLAKLGLIILHMGRARGIELPDPTDMLSDSQLELINLARGWTVVKPQSAAQPLVAAYPVESGTDFQLPVEDLIAQIDARATAGAGYDPSEACGG
jgi:SOS-response transcriptional repressor LexA